MSTIVFARNAANRDTVKAIEFAARWLTDLGHAVHIYSNGKEALEAMRERGRLPDVLFADELMPECDGYELIMTAHRAFPETELKAILAPVMTSIGKPWYSWTFPIAGYVAIPYSPWQVVLSVEQVLCRHITPNPITTEEWESQEELRLKICGVRPSASSSVNPDTACPT